MVKVLLGLFSIIILVSCTHTETINEHAVVTNTESYEYNLGFFGDEEGARIKSQANHYETSALDRNHETSQIIYKYKAKTGYTGTDDVEIVLSRGSNGASPNTQTIVKISLDIKEEQSTSITQEIQPIEYRYVAAKSGLNYRKEPNSNSEVIGKLDYGKKVQIAEHSALFESIIDDNILIKGEWLGIKIQGTMYYVFGGYLKNKTDFESYTNDISNLIPEGYEIEYKAQGDLNGDTIDDIALVIKRKVNFGGNREVLICLAAKGYYKIDKVSKVVFPNKFFSEDMETYYSEEISISNNELSISLFGTGPVGNNFSTFKYYGEQLLLKDIETYNVGAGSHQSLYYDALKGKLTQELTNTMKEDMPTETKTITLGRKEYQFENASPEDIIIDVYDMITEPETLE